MALFNKQNLKSVVLIERELPDKKFQSMATGFLVGFAVDKNLDSTKREYKIFLLTNRHVFNDQDQLWFRFDSKNIKTIRFPVQLKSGSEIKWLAHKDEKVDLAMLPISPKFLNDNNINWSFINEEIFAYPDNFEKIGIELGDSIFIAGFPMGISGSVQNYSIVRGGIISRIDQEIIKSTKSFFIDAMIFPGNSGGPVFLKPESNFLLNTKAVGSIYLLGVVSGYKPYFEPLFSHQSNPPIVAGISSDNSGLATVVPMNYAKDIYEDFINSNKKLEKEIKGEGRIVTENQK